MQQLKTWKNIGDGQFSLAIDGNQIGSITIERGSLDRKAEVNIGDKKYCISRTGFWRTRTEIFDSKNNLIGSVYPQKWYTNFLTFKFYNKTYKLVFRNNPLAEFAITEGNTDLLAYGIIADNGKVGIKAISSEKLVDYFFDFLLWYWFVPIAVENIGESTAIYPVEVMGV